MKRRYLASLHVRNIKKAGGQVSILDHFGTHAMRAISQNLISRKNTSKEQRRPREGGIPAPTPSLVPRTMSSASAKTKSWALVIEAWTSEQRATLRTIGADQSLVRFFALRSDDGPLECFFTFKRPHRASWLLEHVVEGDWRPAVAPKSNVERHAFAAKYLECCDHTSQGQRTDLTSTAVSSSSSSALDATMSDAALADLLRWFCTVSTSADAPPPPPPPPPPLLPSPSSNDPAVNGPRLEPPSAVPWAFLTKFLRASRSAPRALRAA